MTTNDKRIAELDILISQAKARQNWITVGMLIAEKRNIRKKEDSAFDFMKNILGI